MKINREGEGVIIEIEVDNLKDIIKTIEIGLIDMSVVSEVKKKYLRDLIEIIKEKIA